MVTESANLAGLTVAIIARRNPRLHGCRAFGELSRAVVERRLPAAGRSGTSGRGRQGRGGKGMAGFTGCLHPVVTPVVIPAKREWMIKPLDSSLRWNDGGGWGQEFGKGSKGTVGIANCLFPPRRHSGAGRNPGRRRRDGEGPAGFAGCPRPIVTPVVIPAKREWMIKLPCLLRAGEFQSFAGMTVSFGFRPWPPGRFDNS